MTTMNPFMGCFAQDLVDRLRITVLRWESDGSHPSNWIRRNGLGKTVAVVDRFCGGYQNPHTPIIIGWRAERDSHGSTCACRGVERVYKGDVDRAIARAKKKADAAVLQLYPEMRLTEMIADVKEVSDGKENEG